jgi:spoIIIJ-associated protein
MEFEGKNVDQAVFKAAQELGRAPEDLEYVILERDAERVRIQVEARAGSEPAGPSSLPSSHALGGGDFPSGGRGASGRRDRPPRHDGPPRRGDDRPRRADARPPRPAHDQPARHEERAAAPDHDEGEAPWDRDPIYPDLGTMAGALARAAGLDLTLHVEEDGDTERLRIEGPDAEFLAGEGGETLSALEHLLNKMALRGLAKRGRIRLDSAGYRRRRDEDLVQMAHELADEAKREGGEKVTSPLNPYERRIVHMALRDDPGIETLSVGGGFLKKITIRTHPGGGRPA